jgi:tetratricopeptide (TPR) repeat protein
MVLPPRLANRAASQEAIDAYNQGLDALRKDEFDRAIAAFTQALKLEPTDPDTYYNRARAYSRRADYRAGRPAPGQPPRDPAGAAADYDQVITDCTEAVHHGLDTLETHLVRGQAAQARRQYVQVVNDFTRYAELGGDDWRILNGLAWLLATCPDPAARDGKKAVTYARKAVRLNRSPVIVDTLAAAFAEAGQFEQAARFQGRALQSPWAFGSEAELAKAKGRLKLYQAHKPYREE